MPWTKEPSPGSAATRASSTTSPRDRPCRPARHARPDRRGPIPRRRAPHGPDVRHVDLHASDAGRPRNRVQRAEDAGVADQSGRSLLRARRLRRVGGQERPDPAHQPLRHVRKAVRRDRRPALPRPRTGRGYGARSAPRTGHAHGDLLLEPVRPGVPVPSRIMRGGSWGGSPITSSPKPKCGAVAESRSPAVS